MTRQKKEDKIVLYGPYIDLGFYIWDFLLGHITGLRYLLGQSGPEAVQCVVLAYLCSILVVITLFMSCGTNCLPQLAPVAIDRRLPMSSVPSCYAY